MGLAVVRNLWQGWGWRWSEIFGRYRGGGALKSLAGMGAVAALRNLWQGWGKRWSEIFGRDGGGSSGGPKFLAGMGRGRDVQRRSGQSGGLGEGEGEGEEVKLFLSGMRAVRKCSLTAILGNDSSIQN